jgi:DNA processing protein
MPLSDDQRAHLLLNLVSGLGPKLTKALLERFGSAAGILAATPAALATVPRLSPRIAAQMHEAFRTVPIDQEIELVERFQVRLYIAGQADYPARLTQIDDPPPLLYCRGELVPQDERCLAVVGSRQCTSYGRKMTERLTKELVQAGFTIISGLARGIDGIAHRAALEAGGRTVSVLAGGLAKIYPPEHQELAEQIIQRGALLSEVPMGVAPLAEMFPRRNRIVSGMSLGVLVVEAAKKSGALITARHASEQGRDVFTVPGAVDSDMSGGANELLKKGAVPVTGIDDILALYQRTPAVAAPPTNRPAPPVSAPPPPKPAPSLSGTQLRIWELLGPAGLQRDEIVQKLGLSAPETASALMLLELAGHLRQLPGGRYERKS